MDELIDSNNESDERGYTQMEDGMKSLRHRESGESSE